MHRARSIPAWAIVATLVASAVEAQVTVHPVSAVPGEWERFAIQVVNVIDSPVVAIRVEVPPDIVVAGIEPRPEWPFERDSLADGGARIEWRGGWIANGEFQEFGFLGRLRTDVDLDQVALPVFLTRVGGELESWVGQGATPAPRVMVDRIPAFTSQGTTMLGMVAIVVSFVALVTAIAARSGRAPASGD